MADKKISALTAATTPLAGTEVLPIVQSGSTVKVSVANLTAGRAVAMAGGSFTDNITQSTAAKGVNFTANTPASGMTSQLLNWYEEGTWTPVVEGGTTPGTATYTTQVGRYTRIGNMVTLNCSLAWSAHTGSGVMIVTGLPFTAATVSGLQWVGTIYASNLDFGTNATEFVSLISSAGTTMTFRGLVNNAARTNPALDTSVDALVISITYQAA